MTELTSKRKVMRNTMILYIRMVVTMVVSLFTSRVTLQLLGVDDFGVYGVVGSVIGVFSFLTMTLTTSFNRYLCVALAKDDQSAINRITGASFIIQILIAVVAIAISETVGVWFINHKLVVAPEKLWAAHIVFQFTIVTFVIRIFTSAYNSIIISYERMTAYAYICIFEVVGKLGLVYLLLLSKSDRLILFAAYICIIQALTLGIYYLYVRRQFPLIRIAFKGCREYLKSMLSFAGYGFMGSFGFVIKTQGLNFVLNIFGGPVLNAARSISFQVYSAVYNFVTNFQTAFSPYLLKKQAIESKEACNRDVGIFTCLSFSIMALLMLPIIFFVHPLLHLWLGDNVPEWTGSFTQLILMTGMIEAISSPLLNIIYGKGNIRWLQIGAVIIQSLILYISWWCMRNGALPTMVYVVDLIGNLCLIILRLTVAVRYTEISLSYYTRRIAMPIFGVAAVCALLFWLTPDNVWGRVCALAACEATVIGYCFVMTPKHILQQISKRFLHR